MLHIFNGDLVLDKVTNKSDYCVSREATYFFTSYKPAESYVLYLCDFMTLNKIATRIYMVSQHAFALVKPYVFQQLRCVLLNPPYLYLCSG